MRALCLQGGGGIQKRPKDCVHTKSMLSNEKWPTFVRASSITTKLPKANPTKVKPQGDLAIKVKAVLEPSVGSTQQSHMNTALLKVDFRS